MATNIHAFSRYEVFFTVLVSNNEYGATVNVTQDVDVTDLIKQVSNIKNEVDNGDYDVGVFTFGDITINCSNHDRKFSPADDWRSIFPYKRDRTKVDIVFYDDDQNETFSFRGLLNDEATRAEIVGNDVKFRILSIDSILRQVRVTGGAIAATQTFSSAIKTILNVPEITNVVSYDPANIELDLDLEIDDGEFFTEITSKEALDNILIAANSILYIDKTNTLYVKPRRENVQTFYFFGRGDLYGRDNIFKITGYNSGVQRAFSSVKVNDTTVTDEAFVEEYGFRQKSVSLNFINLEATERAIAQNILDNFKVPKEELEIEVPIKDAQDIELLDTVSVDFNYRLVPAEGETSIPQYSVAQYGVDKYPRPYGSYKIDPIVKWKVISIRENLKSLSKTLKLRVAGTTAGDGVFLYGLEFDQEQNSMYLGIL